MIEMVECACAIPTTMQGRVLEDVARGVDAETVRQPVGVCAAIVPFNFPAMVPFWFLPFAIACGNTFVLKPSEQVPLTQQIAFEVLDALGLPPGRRQPRQRRPRGGRGDPRPPGDRRRLLRRLGAGRAARLRARRRGGQARAGARRGQEPHGRDARRRGRQDGRRDHRLGLRRRRPALHGGLGRSSPSARPTSALLPALARGRPRRCGSATALDEAIDVGPVVSRGRPRPDREWIERGVAEGADAGSSTGASPGADGEGAFVGPTILDGVAPRWRSPARRSSARCSP